MLVFGTRTEAFNRQATGILAGFNFAPTYVSRENLLREDKAKNTIYVTGNTAIDALKTTVKKDYTHPQLDRAKDSRLIMLTALRRENLGEPLNHMLKVILMVMVLPLIRIADILVKKLQKIKIR